MANVGPGFSAYAKVTRMTRFSFAAAFAAALAVAVPASALDVVYVIRHAQKDLAWDGDGRLRPLSEKGARCAAARAETLPERAEIVAVYASETARTLSTGVAISSALDGVPIIGDDATAAPDADWAAALRERHRGDSGADGDKRAIVVVGHSNTVGELVLAFRPDAEECLSLLRLARAGVPESRYGDLWVLDLDGRGCRGIAHEPPLRLGPGDGDDCATQ